MYKEDVKTLSVLDDDCYFSMMMEKTKKNNQYDNKKTKKNHQYDDE